MILTVTLNPSLDQTLFVEKLIVGDTNRVGRVESDAGGKGINLSRIAAQIGAKTLATGLLGGPTGTHIRAVLDVAEVAHDFEEIAAETRSNFNIESASGDPPTTINARGPQVQIDEWARFCDRFHSHLNGADWVCFCGSLPPGVPADAYSQMVRIAKAEGKQTLVDADGDAMHAVMALGPTLIKPNEKEAERLLGRKIEDPIQAAVELFELQGDPDAMTILSLGADGAVLATSAGTWRGHSPDIEAVSSVGSGDSMLGAFLARLTAGDPVEIAFQWGLAAGAATATTNGAHIGQLSAIELLFDDARFERVS